jgi:hypothetical protein
MKGFCREPFKTRLRRYLLFFSRWDSALPATLLLVLL